MKNNNILKTSAAIVGAFLLAAASISGGGVAAQDATPTAATGMGGPMSMTGACTTGLAASMLSQAQMMVTPMATMDPAMTTPMATTDPAMTTPEAPTAEATMDMSTPSGDATAEATADSGTGAAITEPWCFVVFLSGAAEKPDMGDPDGYGVAAITVDPTNNVVTFDVAVAGITLPATMSHIHKGAIDAGGDVVIPANGAPDTNGVQMSTSDPADAALIQDILANPTGYYFNVHTDDFPKGALRGQLSLGDMAGMGTGGDMSGTMMPTEDMSGTAMAPTATP